MTENADKNPASLEMFFPDSKKRELVEVLLSKIDNYPKVVLVAAYPFSRSGPDHCLMVVFERLHSNSLQCTNPIRTHLKGVFPERVADELIGDILVVTTKEYPEEVRALEMDNTPVTVIWKKPQK